MLGVQLDVGADVERAPSSLVVRRERDELEDSFDVTIVEPGFQQPFRRAAAHESLRARAGVDPGRLDPDNVPDPGRGRGGDSDQPDHLLRGEAGDGRSSLEWVSRHDPHLGAERALALDDCGGDVLCERLDEERLTDDDLLDRLLEQLREARHVDALLRCGEIDRTVDLGCAELLTPLATVSGFARTIQRNERLEAPLGRYIDMIAAAADQMTELLETLALAGRVEGGRFDPPLVEVDMLEAARAAAEEVEGARADGEGAVVETNREGVTRSLAAFAL